MMRRAVVLVLGDFGRSPRMMYHTMSLAQQHVYVDVVAMGGSAPLPLLTEAPNVRFSLLEPHPAWLSRLPRLLFLMLKVLHQLLQLLWLLLVHLPKPDIILMQNPPAIPTMVVCWLAAMRHGARMVVDWHNFGYSIMGLSMGPRHWVVKLARHLEVSWGRRGHVHLCVTRAMQAELQNTCGIQASVLYDRPPSFFKRTDTSAAHQLFCKLAPALEDPSFKDFLSSWHHANGYVVTQGTATIVTTQVVCTIAANGSGSSSTGIGTGDEGSPGCPGVQDSPECSMQGGGGSTSRHVHAHAAVEHEAAAATHGPTPQPPPPPPLVPPGWAGDAGAARWRECRPALVVSSTSWTPDEDFGMLLEAACAYDRHASQPQHASLLPDVLFLITGRGPQQALYLARLRALPLQRVAFRSVWLDAPDYPALLGCADIGVSLHASSSGLDLPMKVVDMFGCGLPVCALAYSCISELVSEGETGLLFSSAQGLADHLAALLHGFSARAPNELLRRLKTGVQATQHLRWEDNWQAVAWPSLSGTANGSPN